MRRVECEKQNEIPLNYPSINESDQELNLIISDIVKGAFKRKLLQLLHHKTFDDHEIFQLLIQYSLSNKSKSKNGISNTKSKKDKKKGNTNQNTFDFYLYDDDDPFKDASQSTKAEIHFVLLCRNIQRLNFCKKGSEEFNELIDWFGRSFFHEEQYDDHPFSFQTCCMLEGYDYSALRLRIISQHARHLVDNLDG